MRHIFWIQKLFIYITNLVWIYEVRLLKFFFTVGLCQQCFRSIQIELSVFSEYFDHKQFFKYRNE